jgi:predicted nucleic acid-binding protein
MIVVDTNILVYAHPRGLAVASTTNRDHSRISRRAVALGGAMAMCA